MVSLDDSDDSQDELAIDSDSSHEPLHTAAIPDRSESSDELDVIGDDSPHLAAAAKAYDDRAPSFKQAMSGPEREQWLE